MAALRALYAMDEWSALTLASNASISLDEAFCHKQLPGRSATSSIASSTRLACTHQVPLQVPAHLPLHLVHLLQLEHLLRDDTPTLVRVRVVADDLAGDHERRDEKSVPG